MTTDPLETIRDQLMHGVAGERTRTAKRRTIASAALVVVLVAGAALAFASPWSDGHDGAVVASEGPQSSTTELERPDRSGTVGSEPIWAIEQPPGWDRAGRDLMPNLGWDSLTMATIPLRPGGELCAQVPEQALRDMGPDDALLSIFFGGSATSQIEPWPDDFGPGDLEKLENSDPAECAERSDLEIHWGERARSGQSLGLLVAFGSDTTDAVRAQTWSALDSFRPLDRSADSTIPDCVVTIPPSEQPSLPTTGPDDRPPAGQGWIGTPDLWTALPYSGTHVQRKSAWWSEKFPGGSVEEQPPIQVTWTALGAEDRPQIVAPSPGTNAHSADTGWFMINGIDPDEPGCWEVTAEYKGSELSYVYWSSERQASVDAGVMPDLVGADLNTLGDVEGVLYLLQDILGDQTTIIRADDAPEGTVITQDPAPGTPLSEIDNWMVTVSGGGPVVHFRDLPDDVSAYAQTLAGFDVDEPLVERQTEFGTVYKSDRWLFGLDCAAVDAAYRTFLDARYDTACPESGG